MLNWATKLIRKLTTSTHDLLSSDLIITNVAYSEHLIQDLKLQHTLMNQLYDQITASIEELNFKQLSMLITKLKKDVHKHYIEENTKFYRYLAQKFKHDACLMNHLKTQQAEMSQIHQRFNCFIKKWQNTEIDHTSVNEFHQEFVEIRYILVQRATNEEHSSYFLYQP